MRWRLLSISSLKLRCRRELDIIVRTAANLSFKLLGDSLNPEDAPILLLHGLLSNKKHWEGLGKTIQNITKRAVFAADLRNHGDSPHATSHKYVELAEDVLELLNRIGVKRATLIGHSMGGRTAMCVALMSPANVTSLIVVDASPISICPDFIKNFPKLLDAMNKINFEKLEQKKVSKAKKLVKKELRSMVPDDHTMTTILSNINVKRDGTIGWTCNLEVLIKYFNHISTFPKIMMTKKYHGPALFIGGQLSEFISADDLPGIRELFPSAIVTYIEGTGHNLQVDDPKSFLEMVIAFAKTYK